MIRPVPAQSQCMTDGVSDDRGLSTEELEQTQEAILLKFPSGLAKVAQQAPAHQRGAVQVARHAAPAVRPGVQAAQQTTAVDW